MSLGCDSFPLSNQARIATILPVHHVIVGLPSQSAIAGPGG
jgi:hypothetical protein